jgi:H-type lectin domain.
MADDQVTDQVSTGTQETVDTAKRLGLTWTLRPGEVATTIPFTVTLDGDSEAIDMTSMIGTNTTGDRVYCLFVPPAGNFVIGKVAAQEVGEELVSFITQSSFTVTVTFQVPFLVPPVVMTNIDSPSGATAGWHSRAFGVTTTGFTLFLFGGSSTWTNIEVQWLAVAR